MALTRILGPGISTTASVTVGIITATTFDGDIAGNVTGNVTGTATSAQNIVDPGGSEMITCDAAGIVVTGIATISDEIRVGGAVTANSTGINVTGVVTATSFYGSGANLTGLSAGISTSRAIFINYIVN